MFKIRNYKVGFDAWGLVLFLVILLPNLIWFAVPAPNDPLRKESVTPIVDGIASVFQVGLVLSLCVVIHRQSPRPMKKAYFGGIIVAVILYFIGWILYYVGRVHAGILLDLCLAPCLAFLLFSLARKNGAAFLAAGAFAFCHVLYAAANFL